MSLPIVQDLPHLLLDESSKPHLLRLEDRTTLDKLIRHGASQHAGKFYREMRFPSSGFAYLLEYHQPDVDFAIDYLLEKPWFLAHALKRRNNIHSVHINSGRDVIELLKQQMYERSYPGHRHSELADYLHSLTWAGHDLPFRHKHNIRRVVESALDRAILDSAPQGWQPASDPEARLLLAVNHWRVLIDLRENFIASVDDHGKTVQCQQFEHRHQLLQWILGVAGREGQVRLLPWNHRMEMPRLSLLGELRSWTRHIRGIEDGEQSMQMEMDVDDGVWGWLGGRAAFCEPVRHRMQGNQEDRPELRLQMLTHQTGELIHPGYPSQPHRLGREAPAVEVYRPVNPFSPGSEKSPSKS